jgi:hypothetical protein
MNLVSLTTSSLLYGGKPPLPCPEGMDRTTHMWSWGSAEWPIDANRRRLYVRPGCVLKPSRVPLRKSVAGIPVH